MRCASGRHRPAPACSFPDADNRSAAQHCSDYILSTLASILRTRDEIAGDVNLTYYIFSKYLVDCHRTHVCSIWYRYRYSRMATNIIINNTSLRCISLLFCTLYDSLGLYNITVVIGTIA